MTNTYDVFLLTVNIKKAMVLEHNRFVVLNIIDFTVPLPRQDADITGDT